MLFAKDTTPVIQPLIDFFEAILLFFHDTVGLQWGFAIIALTILVRACLLPLTFKQYHSMQRLAQPAARDEEAPGASSRTTRSASTRR